MCFMQGGSRCLFYCNCCNQDRYFTCLLLEVSAAHISPSPWQGKGCGDYPKRTMILVSRFRKRGEWLRLMVYSASLTSSNGAGG